jgi:hypothetical protein
MRCSVINADTYLEKDFGLSSAIQHLRLFVLLTCTKHSEQIIIKNDLVYIILFQLHPGYYNQQMPNAN